MSERQHEEQVQLDQNEAPQAQDKQAHGFPTGRALPGRGKGVERGGGEIPDVGA